MTKIQQSITKLFLLLLTSAVSFNSFSQAKDSTNYNKHELGISASSWAGRISKGIQYYYSIKPSQQVGVNLSSNYLSFSEGNSLFYTRLSLDYRWKLNIIGGLNGYVAPTVSYDYTLKTLEGFTGQFHGIGAGINKGLEYDFSTIGAPIVLGAGVKSRVHYYRKVYRFSLDPTISLRVKF